jgi:hypothetical protein
VLNVICVGIHKVIFDRTMDYGPEMFKKLNNYTGVVSPGVANL